MSKDKIEIDKETSELSDVEASPGPDETVPALTAEQVEGLKIGAAKATEHWERFVRLTADFENFKKRATRERDEARKFANESLLEKLIPVLDNFDMALAAASATKEAANESLQAGIGMIYNQLRGALKDAGLEEVDASGKPFDPNWHEAVAEQESADVAEGQVLQQLRKGYKLRERLLRPATVVVAKKTTTASK
ncbi:MAG: nucleotide exchange factor GrpE [Verrucomicrobia bacterium]|nr:nucleotide exchange factor GrpE [Verrucomicrobiota bacterium]